MAIVGKVVIGFILFGKLELNKLAIGVGMIFWGEVGLVFVGVGVVSGVLDFVIDVVIIVMVIVIIFVVFFWLWVVFEGVKKEEVLEKLVFILD